MKRMGETAKKRQQFEQEIEIWGANPMCEIQE